MLQLTIFGGVALVHESFLKCAPASFLGDVQLVNCIYVQNMLSLIYRGKFYFRKEKKTIEIGFCY